MIPKEKRVTQLAQHPAAVAARKSGAPVILCGLCGDTVDALCERGAEQALEMEKTSLNTALCANSFYLDAWKNLFTFPAAISSFWGAMAQAYATCFELQMQWLGLSAPHEEGVVGGELETLAPTTKEEQEEMEKGIDTAVEAFEEEILA
jgi:hypothetical protein